MGLELQPEEELIELLKRDDPETWALLMNNYSPDLRRQIRKELAENKLPKQELSDIEQETWLVAREKIGNFEARDTGSLFGWLCTIQRFRVKNLWHKTRRRKEVPLETVEDLETSGTLFRQTYQPDISRGRDTEDEVIRRESEREIFSDFSLALREVASKRDRQIVVRRLVWRESVDELAALYKLPKATISQIVSNAKKRIRDFSRTNALFAGVNNRVNSDKGTD